MKNNPQPPKGGTTFNGIKMPITVMKVKNVRNISELDFGKMYHLDGEVYIYAGKDVFFPGSYMFVCPEGKLFANEKLLTNCIEAKQFWEVRQIRPHKSVEN